MSDLEIIKELEKVLGREIPEVGNINSNTVGYILDDRVGVHSLSLYGCGAKTAHLGIIGKLTSLTELYLENNQITKIEGLEELTNLIDLKLSSNKITKIEGLENLTNLTWLNLNSNQISKIEGLENLTNLTWLNLNSNQISKIEGLENLTVLSDLWLSKNQIRRVEGLKCLTKLTILDLSSNQISKIEGLENLINLQSLWLNNNQISKFEGLDGLTNLQRILLNYNQITKIEELENLKSLEYLRLSNNQINNLQELNNLHKLNNLTELLIQNNKIQSGGGEIEEKVREILPNLNWDKDTYFYSQVTPQRGNKVLKFSKVYEDALGNGDLATMTAGILDNMDPRLETMFGVFGEWGRGKTFFINQVIDDHLLSTKENPKRYLNHKYIRVDYHAWKYQNTPANWAYLYQLLLEGYLEDRATIKNKRFDWLNKLTFSSAKKLAIIDLNLIRNNPDIWWIHRQYIKVLILVWQIPLFIKLFVIFVLPIIFYLGYQNFQPFAYFADYVWQSGFTLVSHLGLLGFFENTKNWIIAQPVFATIAGFIVSSWVVIQPIIERIGNKQNQVKITATAQDFIKKYGEARTFEDKLGVQAEIDKEIEILLKVWIPVDEVEIELKKSKLKEEEEELEKNRKIDEVNKKNQEQIELDKKFKPYKKIILFIDDLDRCNEASLIELIDSLRIMLEQKGIQKRMQIVVAVDERILQLAIRHKYGKMKLGDDDFNEGLNLTYQNLSLEYLDKLFLLGVKLVDLEQKNRQRYQEALNSEDQKIVEKAKKVEKAEIEQEQEKNKKIDTENEEINPSPVLESSEISILNLEKSYFYKQEKAFDNDNLAENEIKVLNELTFIISKTRPNFSPRQQLVFYYRFQVLRNLLIGGKADWYEKDNLESISFAVQSLWYKTLEKRNWQKREQKGENGQIIKHESMEKPDFALKQYQKDELAKFLEIAVPY